MKHHLCISDEYCTLDGEVIPFGKFVIEKEITKAPDARGFLVCKKRIDTAHSAPRREVAQWKES
jgi:hypothetical protein